MIKIGYCREINKLRYPNLYYKYITFVFVNMDCLYITINQCKNTFFLFLINLFLSLICALIILATLYNGYSSVFISPFRK